MSFSEWKKWLKELPLYLRWFPILVLIRPIADNLYFLKNLSPLISPPYILGIITPALALMVIVKLKIRGSSALDRIYGIWSIFLIFSTLMILVYDYSSMLFYEYLLKLTLPIYLYYFLRRMVRSKRDLHGILISFIYSAIPVAILLLYEVLFNPIRIEESRGMERIQGNFGDVMSYGIYITLSFLVVTYFLLKDFKGKLFWKNARLSVLVTVLGIIGLFNMHHISSYSVFTGLFVLFIFYLIKTKKEWALLLVGISCVFIFYLGRDQLDQKVGSILAKDIAVLKGEVPENQLLHGRFGRWKFMMEHFSDQPIVIQLIGYPLTFIYVYNYVGMGAHNDYFRLLFFTGYLGLIAYFILLFTIYRRNIILKKHTAYLLIGSIVILTLYSISVTPTLYAPFMYLFLTIVAYVALPDKLLLENERA